MPLPVHTSSEKPSNSETSVSETAANTTQTPTSTSSAAPPQQQNKSEAELAAEKLYEERMEDEYAKREGGA